MRTMNVSGLAIVCVAMGYSALPSQAALLQGGQTIAGGATVTESAGFFAPGSEVVDGNLVGYPAGEWLSTSGTGWVTVDLGRAYRLKDVNLLNSNNGGGGNLRATNTFSLQLSATGAFAGEEVTNASGTLQDKTLGWQDVPLPAFGNPVNNSQLVGRYVRFNALTFTGPYGPGLTEIAINGVANRGTGAMQNQTSTVSSIQAKAYTATVNLTDAAPSSWTLRRLVPTSASIVQSLGKPTSSANAAFSTTAAALVDNINNGGGGGPGGELLFGANASVRMPDLSDGSGTIDLGQSMIVDRIDLRNAANFGDRGTQRFILRVSDDPTFAEGNNTDVVVSTFTAYDQALSFTLSQSVLGRYVRFVSSDYLGTNGGGLDEMTVFARTFTSDVLASGTGQIGDSVNFGTMNLATPLGAGSTLLALTVNSDAWSSTTLTTVTVIPEPAAGGLLVLAMAILRRRV